MATFKVRFITAITVVLAAIFSTLALTKVASLQYTGDTVATHLELLWEILHIAHIYPGEAVSYAYFIELNREFNADQYRDEDDEKWTPPSWFSDPPAGITKECNGIECMIWNLDSTGTSENNPCPKVVTYTPNPPVTRDVLKELNQQEINALTRQFSGELNTLINKTTTSGGTTYGLETYGQSVDILYLEQNIEFNTYNTEINIDSLTYVQANVPPSWGTLKKTNRSKIQLVAGIGSKLQPAYCICDRIAGPSGPGNNIVLAWYDVNVIYVHILVKDMDNGRKIVEGEVPYIKFFQKRTDIVEIDPGDEYNNCQLVTP